MTNLTPEQLNHLTPVNAPAGRYVSPVYGADMLYVLEQYPQTDGSDSDFYELMDLADRDNLHPYTLGYDPYTTLTDNDVIDDLRSFYGENGDMLDEDVEELDFAALLKLPGRKSNGFGGRSKTHRRNGYDKQDAPIKHPVKDATDRAQQALSRELSEIANTRMIWDERNQDYLEIPREEVDINYEKEEVTRRANIPGVTLATLREQRYAKGAYTRPSQKDLDEAIRALKRDNQNRR